MAHACLIVAAVYLVASGTLFAIFGRRDTRAGGAFQSTRDQVHKNLQWIRQLFLFMGFTTGKLNVVAPASSGP